MPPNWRKPPAPGWRKFETIGDAIEGLVHTFSTTGTTRYKSSERMPALRVLDKEGEIHNVQIGAALESRLMSSHHEIHEGQTFVKCVYETDAGDARIVELYLLNREDDGYSELVSEYNIEPV